METTLDDVLPTSYFLVNLKQTGYYRVQYDEANWMLIANELSHGNFSAIPPNSRAMLIDDAAVFFENKILNIRILLELLKYLEHDVSEDREENFYRPIGSC
jgi:aminopeptidase N